MSDRFVKLYKNPYRNNVVTSEDKSEVYVPHYKMMGIEPENVKSKENFLDAKLAVPEKDESNPRLRTLSIRHETDIPNHQLNVGGLVNVGNNMEHTWSGVDGEIFDDVSSLILDDNREMIDNNDFVEIKEPSKQESNIKRFLTEVELKEAITTEFQEKLPALPLIGEDEYILLVDSVVIDIGPINKIEEQANLLVFGDHEICEGNPVPAENLLILKRVKIKVGLFLE